jgi:hypothetical protein
MDIDSFPVGHEPRSERAKMYCKNPIHGSQGTFGGTRCFPAIPLDITMVQGNINPCALLRQAG